MVSSCLSAVFAMEINVTKNLLTGESTVLSTATIPTQELGQHAGLKVFDDGTKCVYALDSPEVPSPRTGTKSTLQLLSQFTIWFVCSALLFSRSSKCQLRFRQCIFT